MQYLLQRLRALQGGEDCIFRQAADAIEQYSEERVLDRARIEALSNRVAVLKDYIDDLERRLGSKLR